MTYDFEYNNIIDYWADKYGIKITDKLKTYIIDFYKEVSSIRNIPIDFDVVCKNIVLDIHYNKKYPGLELRRHVYSIAGMN